MTPAPQTPLGEDTIEPIPLSTDSRSEQDPPASLPDAKEDAVSPVGGNLLSSDQANDENPRSDPHLTKFQGIMLAGTMMSTSAMTSLPTSAGLLAVPIMADYYQESALAVQWGVGLLVAGRLADLYGRKKLFLLGMTIGSIANIISAVLPNRFALTMFRAISGLGFSISAPAAFGITGTTFRTEPARTRAFAALGVGTPLGGVVGVMLGGVMAGLWRKGWQYVFFMIAGSCLIPIIGGILFIPSDTRPPCTSTSKRKIDWLGAGLVTVGLSLLMFSVTQAGIEEEGWRTAYIPAVFAFSIVILTVFGLWEHYAEHRTTTPPIVKLSVFTRHHWRVTAILGIIFCNWCGIAGWMYSSSYWFQGIQGYSPKKNAACIVPASVVGVLVCVSDQLRLLLLLASPPSAPTNLNPVLLAIIPIVPRVNAPIVLAIGAIFTGLANALLAFPSPDESYWKFGFWSAFTEPWGGDLTIPIGSIMMSNLCAENEQSVCGALFSVSMQVASTVDMCLTSLIQTQVEAKHGLLRGVRVSFWFNAAVCWFALIILLVAFRKVKLAKDVAKVVV
ncbi:hypothetical protein I317_07185 [Kwoniella heveanensis CBS 569]|nr:hypothetical protein I317_07185 [Kwoniella heveanensis CBS 569]